MFTLFARYYLRRAWNRLHGRENTVCAHCQKAAGEKPTPDQSHGICPRHLLAMRNELRNLKLSVA